MIAVCGEFWKDVLSARDYIAKGWDYRKFLPTADKTEAWKEYVKEKVPVSAESIMQGNEDDYMNCLEYKKLKEQEKEITQKIVETTNAIRNRMIFTEEFIDADTGMPRVEQRHFEEMAFPEDPNSRVRWNKKSNGADNFMIYIAKK